MDWVVFGWINKNITFRWNLKSFWFVGFYLVYLLGVFYTKDSDQALKYLENKLPFLIFPFFFCFDTKKIVRLPSIVSGLLIGVTALSFIGYWKGLVCYGETGALDCLMTISLSEQKVCFKTNPHQKVFKRLHPFSSFPSKLMRYSTYSLPTPT